MTLTLCITQIDVRGKNIGPVVPSTSFLTDPEAAPGDYLNDPEAAPGDKERDPEV